MRPALSRSALLVLLAAAACEGAMPPPPVVVVTSPERGLVQRGAAQVTVKGTALPGVDGNPIAKVMVNKVPAILAADGSFTAMVDVPVGASLIETVAISEEGGAAT